MSLYRSATVGRARALLAATVLGGGLLAVAGGAAVTVSAGAAGASSTKVLLVGSYRGHVGPYKTIQSAVNAAKPGDWILVAPGDYRETDTAAGVSKTAATQGDYGGVLIHTPDIHLRGMTRTRVIVDGTKSGAPCSSAAANQNFGTAAGRNGIVVFKANGVSVQNLTACNFLAGKGSSGNAIWWNGGAGSGQVGLHGYTGMYLTATSSYFGSESTAATYGIFSSNSSGGSWNYIYANNFNDSGMYVGACHQICTMTINHAWMENNVLGYSGTNSGGKLVIENSQFDNNKDGFDTNTQISGDPPAPQNGDCPDTGISPITHTHSCWVFIHNYSHNNNNPTVPGAGTAAVGPVGTGMTVSGAHNDTVMDNVFATNGAWGILFVPWPTGSTPSLGQTCVKIGGVPSSVFGCVSDPEGDALLDNTFKHDGWFGNPTNSDFGQIVLNGGQPSNCFRDNTYPDGSAPPTLEKKFPQCGVVQKTGTTGGQLLTQVLCNTGITPCGANQVYPQQKHIYMKPVPKVRSMPNPCKGVPANPWCPSKTT